MPPGSGLRSAKNSPTGLMFLAADLKSNCKLDRVFFKFRTSMFDKRGSVHSKFMFSEKAKKIEEIFTVDLTLCSKCQID